MLEQIRNNSIGAPVITNEQAPSQETMNQVLLINGVSSIDGSIQNIATELKAEMAQKKSLRDQISAINLIMTKPKANLPDGSRGFEITPAQTAFLNNLLDGKLVTTDLNGKKYVTEDTLAGLKDSINGTIQDLNSGAEIRSIELQSLIDQRKNMILMLSNMMASSNEVISAIVRNIK